MRSAPPLSAAIARDRAATVAPVWIRVCNRVGRLPRVLSRETRVKESQLMKKLRDYYRSVTDEELRAIARHAHRREETAALR